MEKYVSMLMSENALLRKCTADSLARITVYALATNVWSWGGSVERKSHLV